VARRSNAHVVEVEPSGIRWVKSSVSGTNAESSCLEVALLADSVLVRDSKDRPGPRLTIAVAGWAALIESLRMGPAVS
jgi:hypothetical protein